MWADTEHQQSQVRSAETEIREEDSGEKASPMDDWNFDPPGNKLQPSLRPSSWINDRLNQAGSVFSWALKTDANGYTEQDWRSFRLFLQIELLLLTLLIISALGDTFELRRLIDLRTPNITDRAVESAPQNKVVFDSFG